MTRSPSVPDSSSIEKTSENAESAGRHVRAGFLIRISKSQDVPTPSLRANGSAQTLATSILYQRRPCERRDPYAAASLGGAVADAVDTTGAGGYGSLRSQGRQRAHPKHG